MRGRNDRIPVYVRASDPLSEAGVTHTLRHRPEVWLLDLATPMLTVATAQSASAGAATAAAAVAPPGGPCPIALVVADTVDDQAVEMLREVRRRGCDRTVLIVTRVDDASLLRAVEAGVTGLVRREDATAEHLIRVIRVAAAGEGSLPTDLLGRLLGQVSKLQRQAAHPHAVAPTGLSDRETRVLRLVADGLDTQEIARQLAYSERTVKNVLHDITSRLQLRNRSHAVAFALREGLI